MVQQAILLLAGLTPFGMALVAQAVGTQARPQPVDVRPALVFDQYLVNLGRVTPRREHAARFVFTNLSDRPVHIKQLKPSCGCLNPNLEKRDFHPHETGEFFLRVQTANEQPGPKTYHCAVLYDDTDSREVDLAFKLVLPQDTVTVRPRSLILYALGDAPIVKDILVTDYRQHPLQVLGVECSLDVANVTLGERTQDDRGSVQQAVVVRTGPVPVGRHRGVITILTDDPDFSPLRVPLWIERPDAAAREQTAACLAREVGQRR